MIRRVRPPAGAYLNKRLGVYQQRVDNAQAATVRGVVKSQWRLFRESKAGLSAATLLSDVSHDRCYYCEYCPGTDIDHFRPSSAYRNAVFNWSNYNWSCNTCNRTYKGNQWSPELLDPSDGEEAADYFVLDETTGELIPDQSRPPSDQAKAVETARIYGLNREKLKDKRCKYVRDFRDDLDAYIAAPTPHGATSLLRYLRPEAEFRSAIRLCVHMRDATWQARIAAWVNLSAEADRLLRDAQWWP